MGEAIRPDRGDSGPEGLSRRDQGLPSLARLWLLLALVAGPLGAQPVVSNNGVVNAAGYFKPPVPGSAIAPGSIFSVFGEGLAAEAVAATEFPLQETLAGLSVEIITDPGEVFQALPLYASESQVNAVLPSSVPVGEHTLAVVRDGERSAGVRFKVVRTSVGIFHTTDSAYPMLAGQSLDQPLRPGETFSIWATGLGAIDASDALAAPSGDLPASLEVWVGDQPAEIAYQGRSSCCAGLDQIDVRLPDEVATSCYTPVWAALNGALFSNIVTIPTAGAGEPCAAPVAGPIGRLSLMRFADQAEPRDFATAWFATRPPLRTSFDPARWPAAGTCLPEPTPVVSALLLGSLGRFGLDAGDRFTLDGPLGETILSFPEPQNPYVTPVPFPQQIVVIVDLFPDLLEADPPLDLIDGAYRVESEGGLEFPAFTAEVTMSSRDWRVAEGVTRVPRSHGVGAEWTPGAEDASVLLTAPLDCAPVDGVAACILGTVGGPPPPPEIAGGFVCRSTAAAGAFEVPEAFYANLPATPRRLRATSVGGPAPMQFETDGPETGLVTALHSTSFPLPLSTPHLPSTPVFLPDGTQIQAELATNPAEQQRGLMFRTQVPRGRGMLFLFRQPSLLRFWMFNTLTPLDMIFLDAERRIVLIAPDRQPCEPGAACPLTGPDTPAQFVLELAAGEAARLGLSEGDQLDW